ncbi:MAG: hypothetical protein O3B01_05565 [Planctomycetota bacterium]|nr:hypothetical protein [Planctomycetota bacterium]MDA1138030.1 hypothetical protein [Planctomycetota bacterium]
MRTAITIFVCLPMHLLLGGDSLGLDERGQKGLAENSSVSLEGKKPLQSASTTKPACSSGCAVVTAKNEKLLPVEIRQLLEKFSTEEIGKATTALETLLFHADQLEDWLAANGCSPLNSEHAAFFEKELKHGRESHVSARIVDAEGRLRMDFDQSVPVGKKQHLHVYRTEGIAAPILSFTVKRVGLHHLWARL